MVVEKNGLKWGFTINIHIDQRENLHISLDFRLLVKFSFPPEAKWKEVYQFTEPISRGTIYLHGKIGAYSTHRDPSKGKLPHK